MTDRNKRPQWCPLCDEPCDRLYSSGAELFCEQCLDDGAADDEEDQAWAHAGDMAAIYGGAPENYL